MLNIAVSPFEFVQLQMKGEVLQVWWRNIERLRNRVA